MKLPINYTKSHHTVRKAARLQYIEEQDGRCYCCDEPLDKQPSETIMAKPINRKLFPKGMFLNPIHLHHCHVTNLTLGAVHARCNAYLWQYHKE